MSKKGFTLAEVLITLGVIGVVAAMTLPTLIKNYNNYVTAQKLKKAYNTLSNGIRMAEVDYGPMKDWPIDANTNMKNFYETYFQPYFKGIKRCSNYSSCGYKNLKYKGLSWSLNSSGSTRNTRVLFKLIDGTIIFYPNSSDGYTTNIFYIDINGAKEPNEVEKDVYQFKRGTTKGIEPIGKALKIMQDGWKIK